MNNDKGNPLVLDKLSKRLGASYPTIQTVVADNQACFFKDYYRSTNSVATLAHKLSTRF